MSGVLPDGARLQPLLLPPRSFLHWGTSYVSNTWYTTIGHRNPKNWHSHTLISHWHSRPPFFPDLCTTEPKRRVYHQDQSNTSVLYRGPQTTGCPHHRRRAPRPPKPLTHTPHSLTKSLQPLKIPAARTLSTKKELIPY